MDLARAIAPPTLDRAQDVVRLVAERAGSLALAGLECSLGHPPDLPARALLDDGGERLDHTQIPVVIAGLTHLLDQSLHPQG